MKQRLNEFFVSYFGINFLNENKDLSGSNFFGKDLRISPVNLLYVYDFIQTELEIEIDEEFILDDGFTSFDSLVSYLSKKKSKIVIDSI